MQPMIICGLIAFFFVIAAVWFAWNKGPDLAPVIICLVIAGFFGLGSVGYAIQDVGYGHVAEKPEPFTKRLSVGVSYKVLGWVKDGDDEVAFVKPYENEVATSKLYAIRVREGELPPEHFTLVGNKPFEIVVDKTPKPLK